MIAALCFTAGMMPLANPAKPQPLPARWMLQLAPDKSPELPESFYSTTWYDDFQPRSIRGAWRLWLEFRKGTADRPAEATLTNPDFRGVAVVRSVPLAVHGSFVEFDRRLYTTSIATRPIGDEKRTMLYLGSAIEVKDGVWYQAATRRDGRNNVLIEEWRLEFDSNPRTSTEGTVTARHHRRIVSEPEGHSFVIKTRFTASDPKSDPGLRIAYLERPDDSPLTEIPYLAIGEAVGRENVIWVQGQDRLALQPAGPYKKPSDALPPGLMEPPKK
jgi:hypothetical protein